MFAAARSSQSHRKSIAVTTAHRSARFSSVYVRISAGSGLRPNAITSLCALWARPGVTAGQKPDCKPRCSRAVVAIRSAPQLDDTTAHVLREAAGDRLVSVCRHMLRNLPQDSALADFLVQIPDVAGRDAHTIAGAVKAVEACDDIRRDFRRVLEGFLRASIRRFETKRDRGHDYSEYTVYRRVLVAVDFCRFLEGQGVLSWQEVMQRHLDAFCAARTREQGGRVYPFLLHARRVAPVSAKLRRPRSRRRPTLELAPSFEAHERAVANLIAQPLDEAVSRRTVCRRLRTADQRLRKVPLEQLPGPGRSRSGRALPRSGCLWTGLCRRVS